MSGVWRSLVARTAGGREVAGSNPVAPILKSVGCLILIGLRHFFILMEAGDNEDERQSGIVKLGFAFEGKNVLIR